MKISSIAPLGALFLLLALVSCASPVTVNPGGGSTPGGTTPGGTTPAAVTIDQSLWGPWVRMDRVENWYLAADKLTSPMGSNVYTSATVTKLTTAGATLEVTADSADMIQVTQGTDTFYLYRQADRSATFNGTVEQQVVAKSLARSAEPRSFMSALQLAVQSKDNPSDMQTVFTAIDGSYKIANAIAGAVYKITPKIVDAVTNALADGPTIEVVAGDDGQDVGTVTIPDPTVKYNFKVSAAPAGVPYLFADGTAQNVTVTIKNVGSARSMAPTYTLSSLNSKATLGGTLINNLSTFEPGTTQTITVPVTVSAITTAYVDVTMGVQLDIYGGPSWHDRTTLRFYKDDKLTVNLAGDTSHATLITPDRKTIHFPGPPQNSQGLVVPRKDTGYSLALSGATAASETKYAVWIGSPSQYSPDLTAYIPPGAYEPNNSPLTATGLYINDTAPLLGYLAVDDMDFFAIGAAGIRAPGNLVLTPKSNGKVDLSWTPETTAQSVNLYYDDGTKILTTTASLVTDFALPAGRGLSIAAFNSALGLSTKVPFTVPVMAAPAGLTLTPKSNGKVDVSWTAVTVAENYRLTYTDGTAVTTTTATSLVDVIVPTGRGLRVATFNTALGTSTAADFTFPAMAAPAGLLNLTITGSTASLSWNAVPLATKYFVYINGVAVDSGTAITSSNGLDHAAGSQYSVAAFNDALGYSAAVVAFETVPVAGGTFFNGTANVSVSSFQMLTYEVTQGLYRDVTGSSPSASSGKAQNPVESVTWYDAVEFCNKLSDLAGLQDVYTITGRTPASGYPITSATVTMDMTRTGYRLPTEAEWMWAAMGGATDAKAGDIVAAVNTGGYNKAFAGDNGSNAVASFAWTYENSPTGTQPVGKKSPNELGLYDLSGNVWEWNWDWYGSYDSSPSTDPTGAASGSYRVFRGGSWNYGASVATVSYRSNDYPSYRDDGIGFRVVRP
ncbi:MAG: SUMF1/EgtB/PvdO family nonheme iron enzyme [Spirochaetales bacterium]